MIARRPVGRDRFRLTLAAVALVAAAPACGTILGIEAGTLEGDGGGTTPSEGGGGGHDATTKPGHDAARDAHPDVGSSTGTDGAGDAADTATTFDAPIVQSDGPSDAGLDATSVDATVPPDAAVLIYVSQTTSATTVPCGTIAIPCPSIADGVKQAALLTSGDAVLHVAQGTYTESITVPSGYSIQGGYTSAWTQPDGGDASAGTVITVFSTAAVTVTDIVRPVTLSTLTVTSGSSPAMGSSVYGVLASSVSDASAPVTLENVVIALGPAGAGQPGTTGEPGPAAPSTCGSAAPPATGTAGASATTPGEFSQAGFAPGNGGDGGQGGSGTNGAAGTQVCDSNCFTGCAAGICFEGTFSQTTVCAAGGTAGCGGGGGLGGTGGGGGGSSIGIFAWNVPIIVKGGTVTAGNGGNGASGGPGGNGAQGGMGGDPPTATCHASCAYGSNGCYNSDTTVTGNAGTVGGVGAAGGMGGAGAGGSSYGIYWAGSTPPSLLSGATAHAGNAGSGSVPGIAQGIGTP